MHCSLFKATQNITFIVDKIDVFTQFTGRTIAPLLGLMLLGTVSVVVLRYGFNSGAQALQELVVYLHSAVFMLGFAYTLQSGGHVRVDILYQKLTQRNQALINLLGTAFLLIPMAGFVAYASYDYVSFSWRLNEGSPEPGGLPYVYLMKTLIPLSAVLLLIQALAELLRNGLIVLENSFQGNRASEKQAIVNPVEGNQDG